MEKAKAMAEAIAAKMVETMWRQRQQLWRRGCAGNTDAMQR
jgi:hypothetical protein